MTKPLGLLGKLWILVIVLAAGGIVVATRPRPMPQLLPDRPTVKSLDIPISNDPARLSGSVCGKVSWNGPLPEAAEVFGNFHTPDGPRWRSMVNPLAPRITREGRVEQAVVYLRNFRGPVQKAWPHPSIRIEATETAVEIVQNDMRLSLGLASVGDEIPFSSTYPRYEMIRARGSEFFSLPFAQPGTVRRKLTHPGVVRFTSGMGCHLRSADVWVCEHSYYALTDGQGAFELSAVPPGEYELAVWLRNWKIIGHDRDPETGRYVRLHFGEPFTAGRRISVRENAVSMEEITIGR